MLQVKKLCDGSIKSLRNSFHRLRHHRNQHTREEIKPIFDIRRRNPEVGPVVFWVKLMQHGYKRFIPRLYRFLKKHSLTAVKLSNPKYVPKPCEQMDHPGQRVQIDVKFVLSICLVNKAKGKKFYQHTAIDKYSRWRFVEVFEEHGSYSSVLFLEHLVSAFLVPIERVQTDNGPEFAKRFISGEGLDTPLLGELRTVRHLPQANPSVLSTSRKVGRIHRRAKNYLRPP